jgi:molybdopterin converting factor small subunit
LTVPVKDGATIGELLESVFSAKPQLRAMHKSMLVAVGVEYQDRQYVLRPGDEISLFPPVQGG